MLVVSRTAQLATIATIAGYDPLDARPGDALPWLDGEEVPEADVVLLALDEVEATNEVIDCLRQSHDGIHVVVVANPTAGVDAKSVDADEILHPPVTATAIQTAVASGLKGPPAEPEISVGTALDEEPPPPSQSSVAALEAVAVVTALAERSATLRQLGRALASAAADALDAPAAAVLAPEGPDWSVCGGHGVRMHEERIVLPSNHWLVHDLVHRRRGAIIDRTDVARARLVNAPLAAHQHLVVVSEPVLPALLMVGRDTDPFTEDDLTTAQRLLGHASYAIKEGVALRDLARALEGFADWE